MGTTIIRAQRSSEKPYFSTSRAAAQNKELTFEARGMLWYLLSKPDDWTVNIADLQQQCGRDKVYRLLAELRTAGYLARTDQMQRDDGTFSKVVYTVREEPLPEKPYTDEPYTENQDALQKRENKGQRADDLPKNGKSSGAARAKAQNETVPVALMTPMKNAIAAAFRWQWDGVHAMSSEEKGLIQKVARSLCLSHVSPDDIPALHRFCKKFTDFGPGALPKHLSEWRLTLPSNTYGISTPVMSEAELDAIADEMFGFKK